MRKKTIILCAPSDFGLFEAIKRGLEDLEYTVLGFPIEDGQYKYKNPISRVINTFRKVFLNDKEYKNKLKLKERSLFLNKELSKIKTADFALFIRPDMYPINFIKNVQKIARKTSAYHWDSISRFPNVINYLNLFNRFFVFDFHDSIRYPKTELMSNFYISDPPTYNAEDCKIAYLIGSLDSNRLSESIHLKEILTELGYNCDFTLKTNRPLRIHQSQRKGIKIIKKAIPYCENLNKVKYSGLLIDLHTPRQTGLSFRVFEALNYNKKLITTNRLIEAYDFFHPDNIFIWTEENSASIELFLSKKMVEIKADIKQKYSLGNWIKHIMDDQPYTEISIPRTG